MYREEQRWCRNCRRETWHWCETGVEIPDERGALVLVPLMWLIILATSLWRCMRCGRMWWW